MDTLNKFTSDSTFHKKRVESVDTVSPLQTTLPSTTGLYTPVNDIDGIPVGTDTTAVAGGLSNGEIHTWKLPRLGILRKLEFAMDLNKNTSGNYDVILPFMQYFERIELRTRSSIIGTIYPENILDYYRSISTDILHNYPVGTYKKRAGNQYSGQFVTTLPFAPFIDGSMFLNTKYVEDLELHVFFHENLSTRVFNIENGNRRIYNFRPRYSFMLSTETVERNQFTNYGTKLGFSCYREPRNTITTVGGLEKELFNIPLTCNYPVYKIIINVFLTSNRDSGLHYRVSAGDPGPLGASIVDGERVILSYNPQQLVCHMADFNERVGLTTMGRDTFVDANDYLGRDTVTQKSQWVINFGYGDLRNETKNIYKRGFKVQGFLPLADFTGPKLQLLMNTGLLGSKSYDIEILHMYYHNMTINSNTASVSTDIIM